MAKWYRNKSKRQIKKVFIKSGMGSKKANDIIKFERNIERNYLKVLEIENDIRKNTI